MSFPVLPDTLYKMFQDIKNRLDKLERSNRFTVPVVSAAPTNPRKGDMYLLSTTNTLYIIDNNGAARVITMV